MVTIFIVIFQQQKQENPFQLIRSNEFPTADWQVHYFHYQLIYYRSPAYLSVTARFSTL